LHAAVRYRVLILGPVGSRVVTTGTANLGTAVVSCRGYPGRITGFTVGKLLAAGLVSGRAAATGEHADG
jgi:hypothetical protein